MQKCFAALIACWLVSGPALAGTLNEKDVARLHADITAIFERMDAGDPKFFVDRTHESLIDLVGGREILEQVTLMALEEMKKVGARVLSAELGTPTETYAAGDEEVCFVPRITNLEIEGRKARGVGFMIAIRRIGTDEWKYLDGGGLRTKPDLLYTLLPNLERGIQLPPNYLELQ
jgi:hypothetical protein